MKRRHFLVTVGGLVALAGCYAVAEQEGYLDDLQGAAGGPTTTTAPPTTDGPGGDGSAGPAIDVRDTEFLPGSGEGATGRGRFCATVENVGDVALAAVDLWVEYYDADGVPIESSTVDVHDLASGDVWAACVPYPDAGDRVADHVVGGSFLPADEAARPPEGVTVRGDRLVADDCSVAVEGSLRNAGSAAVDYVEARARFRDADGAVVATGRAAVTDLPGPGVVAFRAEAPRDRSAPDPASVAGYDVSLHGPWW